ncbi:MAG: hypothetical protein ACFBSC_15825 [Microcoleaceae cyanobacterium]
MSDFKATPPTNLTPAQLLDRYQIHEQSLIQNWAKLHGIEGYRRDYSPEEVNLIDHVHHHLHNLGMSVEEYRGLIGRPSQPEQDFVFQAAATQAAPSVNTNTRSSFDTAYKRYPTTLPTLETTQPELQSSFRSGVPFDSQSTTLSSQQNTADSSKVADSNLFSDMNPDDAENDVTQQATDAIATLVQQYSEVIDFMGEQIADSFIEELDASVMRHLAKKIQQRKIAPTQTPPSRLVKVVQAVFKSGDNRALSASNNSGLEMEHVHRPG